METPKGHDRKFLVCLYEGLGVMFFTYLVIVSSVTGSDSWGITGPLALFVAINIFGGVSGGHMNPAVTLGIYVREAKYAHNLMFMLMTIASQCAGAMVGMLFAAAATRLNTPDGSTVFVTAPLLVPSTVAR